MAAAAAADAVVEEVEGRSEPGRCGEVWVYMSLAASVASGETTWEPCEDGV
jgi:hypothetical protein